MRDDLNAIPVFVTVVESGNFASAAAILHVTRSAVGKTIARLEARLGVALFQRTTRRQLLTEEGSNSISSAGKRWMHPRGRRDAAARQR